VKLVWASTALADRKQIREFIARDNPAAALAFDALLSEKVAGLVDFPSLGRSGRVPGTRELVVHTNYILIYDLKASSVRALRVLHAARRWPPEANR